MTSMKRLYANSHFGMRYGKPFSGVSLAAPFLARVVAAGETYLIRDEQESYRASVLLVQVPPTQMLYRPHRYYRPHRRGI
jgi:hypothetical protein